MRRFPPFGNRLPAELRDTRHLDEAARYDLMSAANPEFILSRENPLSWQNEIRFQYIENFVGDLHGLRILDLGCGWGLLVNQMAKSGAHVLGLDISTGVLRLAKSEAVKQRLDTQFIRANAEQVPFNSGLDIVTSTDVLEHVEDLEPLIAEVSRVLKPEGLFFFVTVNKTLLARLVYITFGEVVLKLLPRGTHQYRNFIKPDRLIEALIKHGFEVADLQGILVNTFMKRYHYWPSLAIEYIGVARKMTLKNTRCADFRLIHPY